MRSTKRFFAIIVTILTALTLTVTVLPTQPATVVEAKKVKLNKTSTTIVKGDILSLYLSNYAGKGTWKSSKPSVAKVDKYGDVTAKKAGSATISVKYNKKTYKCKVKVENPKLSKTVANVTVGKTVTLKLKGNTQNVVWSSADTDTATVSKNGVVKGKQSGTVTITAQIPSYSRSGKIWKRYTCNVTVHFDKASWEDVLSVRNLQYDDGVLSYVTNNYAKAVSFEGNIVYLNGKNEMVGAPQTGQRTCSCLAPGETCLLKYDKPTHASTGELMEYNDFYITYNVSESAYTSYQKSVSAKYSLVRDKLTIEISNTSNQMLTNLTVAVVYYDENGNIMAYDSRSAADAASVDAMTYLELYYSEVERNTDTNNSSGSTSNSSSGSSSGSGNNSETTTVYPTSCAVYINEAYNISL